MTTLSKQWIQHNQVAIYAVSVLLAISVGLGLPSASSVLEPLINPVLAVLLYVTFLEIPFAGSGGPSGTAGSWRLHSG